MKLKVCGMTSEKNILEVAQLQPEYLGFIFYEKSARYFNGDIPNLPKEIQKVGVFVNATIEYIIQKITKYDLNVIQLHGSESAKFCKDLKRHFEEQIDDNNIREIKRLPRFARNDVDIIKVFSVDNQFDFDSLPPYESVCDYYLFDTKGKLPGGNGFTFDWAILKNYPSPKPYFLSGGIGLEQLDELKTFLQTKESQYCHAIDVNSKFEIAPGLKDLTKLKKFKRDLTGFGNLSGLTTDAMTYNINNKGYYGDFGGAFIPEMLYPNVEELRQKYLNVMSEPSFKKEFNQLLKDYVGRPSPLYFAKRLSEKYNTTIYLKREDLNHTGAHKINNTIGQILMAKRLGKTRIIAETGAGQHGVATATVCALMGLECFVYIGEIDIARQAPNVARMKMLGATVVPATSGSKTLKDATNEAIRDWINNPVDTHYIIGSVVGPHPYPDMVARFQSVVSKEIQEQLQGQEGISKPNYVVACVGGGSNAAGAYYHFLEDTEVKLIAVEAAGHGVDSGESAATSVLGKQGIIHGSKTLLMQTKDGQITEPYSISAGLDYPGVGPMHAHLYTTGRAEFIAITDDQAMTAGLELCKLEGIIPAIESAHALAIFEQKEFKPNDIVVVSLSGRGDKDLDTYIKHFGL